MAMKFKITVFMIMLLAILGSTFSLVFCTGASANPPEWPLNVITREIAPNTHKAWLADQNEKPFLWNADTCWFLTFAINKEDVLLYLDDRAGKGITVVQCMFLPWTKAGELHWVDQSKDSWFGEKPFTDNKFDKPNETYWRHVDFIVKAAKERNIALCLALAWNGCCGEGWDKVLTNDYNSQNNYEPLRQYARFIGKRYGEAGNVMVFLGGDSSKNREIFALMAEQLKKAAPQILIAHHPSSWWGGEQRGMKSSTSPGQHGQAEYLDISWTYTYWPGNAKREQAHPYWLNHIEWNRNQMVPTVVSKPRPFLFGEGGYENARNSPQHRIRRQMHWSILCGAIGHAFGNRPMWFLGEGWKNELDSPGSQALGHFANIYKSHAWWNLIPEQPKEEFFIGEPIKIAGAETFILSGQEIYDNVNSLDEARGAKFVIAAKTPDGSLLMAYFPHDYSKQGIEIDMTKLAGPAHGVWIDPQNGESRPIKNSPLSNQNSHRFSPPGRNSFGDKDWILVLKKR
ncbi:DUF4038 domain-containing protein [candidate division KSB1 bacterium]|nr:DUF4038 domain-containing protein [candidate division KSB1 bacterium]